jgi:O-acetyl-ADP-ribose deacetylase (regulator of RNase III)
MRSGRIEISRSDITKLQVDAIVNAANSSLLGGGGVDGAIHRAAGAELLKECISLNGCETGEAKITKGYELPSKYIIHTVGPVWKGGNYNEEVLLASCYQKSLLLAMDYNCTTIAFPNISTGVYHFPKSKAAEIAIQEVQLFLKQNLIVEKVIFVCFDDENFDLYTKMLSPKN